MLKKSKLLKRFICPTIKDDVLMQLNLPKMKKSVIGKRIRSEANYEDWD